MFRSRDVSCGNGDASGIFIRIGGPTVLDLNILHPWRRTFMVRVSDGKLGSRRASSEDLDHYFFIFLDFVCHRSMSTVYRAGKNSQQNECQNDICNGTEDNDVNRFTHSRLTEQTELLYGYLEYLQCLPPWPKSLRYSVPSPRNLMEVDPRR